MKYMHRAGVLTLLSISFLIPVLAQESAAESRFNQGDEYLRQNRHKEAIREFEKAISLKSEWAEAYFKLGVAHSKIPITDKDKPAHQTAALKGFQEAVRLKPDWAEAHNELGQMYRELTRTDDAVNSFKEALRLKPSLAEAHQNLAIVYLYQSQYAEGIENLEAAIRIKPDLALAHKLLGLAYLAMDSRDKALEEYNLLKSLDLEMSHFLYSAIQRPERFTFGVVSGKLISTPAPEYSSAARKAHLSGRVTVVVEIDEEGRVTSARASNGPPELARAAEAAALKARFVPTKLSGTPVKVKGVINYDFVP